MLGQTLEIQILAIQDVNVQSKCLFLKLIQSLALYEFGVFVESFRVWPIQVYQISNIVSLFVLDSFDQQSCILSEFFLEPFIYLLEVIKVVYLVIKKLSYFIEFQLFCVIA